MPIRYTINIEPVPLSALVGNSGVKFGTYIDADGKEREVEINILDVESMVARAGGWGTVKSLISASPNFATLEVPGSSERLNTLMTGVRYGGDYKCMGDWGGTTLPAQIPPNSKSDFLSILTKNVKHNTGHMKIEVTKESGGTFFVKVIINNVVTYQESGITMTVGIPRLQTHWGSGVSFEDVRYTTT